VIVSQNSARLVSFSESVAVEGLIPWHASHSPTVLPVALRRLLVI
jgi:hypothetical protein